MCYLLLLFNCSKDTYSDENLESFDTDLGDTDKLCVIQYKGSNKKVFTYKIRTIRQKAISENLIFTNADLGSNEPSCMVAKDINIATENESISKQV